MTSTAINNCSDDNNYNNDNCDNNVKTMKVEYVTDLNFVFRPEVFFLIFGILDFVSVRSKKLQK